MCKCITFQATSKPRLAALMVLTAQFFTNILYRLKPNVKNPSFAIPIKERWHSYYRKASIITKAVMHLNQKNVLNLGLVNFKNSFNLNLSRVRYGSLFNVIAFRRCGSNDPV